MEINLIRLRSELSKTNQDVIKTGNDLIESINDELFEDDLIIKENALNPVFTIVFIETGGTESQFIKLIDKLDKVTILLTSEQNNSLPAALEIKTYLASIKRSGIILFTDEKGNAEFIRRHAFIQAKKQEMKNKNLAVIGEPSDWLIASTCDYETIKEKFGINIVKIGTTELIDEINKHKSGKVPHFSSLEKKSNGSEYFYGATEVYLALKRLVSKYNLSGLTIRCFDLLTSIKNTACLALGLLNEEGIIATCEGDVPTLLSMYIAKLVTNQASFQANPSKIDPINNTIMLCHCTLPLNMCTKYSLPTHFESGIGVAIKGELKTGPCTVMKIWPNLNRMSCWGAEISENLNLPGYCRTQINVKFETDNIYHFLNHQFGNHLVVLYGDYSELLNDFFFDFEINSVLE